MTAADRDGRLLGDPAILGGVFLPFDRQAEPDAILRHLEGAGLLQRYRADIRGVDTPVIQLLAPLWQHQPYRAREMRSKLPWPSATPAPAPAEILATIEVRPSGTSPPLVPFPHPIIHQHGPPEIFDSTTPRAPGAPRSWLDDDAPLWAKAVGQRLAGGEISLELKRLEPILRAWQAGKEVHP